MSRHFPLLLLSLLLISCQHFSPATLELNVATPPSLPTVPAPLPPPRSETITCPPNSSPAAPVHNLQELVAGCDYSSWFTGNTGYTPDPIYFGAYSFLPWGSTLYLGWGKARPAESNGSLFSKYQSSTLTAIYQPSEQGFIDMTKNITSTVIYIPGPDPTDPAPQGGHQWDLGNTYVYTPTTGTITKHRNLPNVIHTWGLESTAAGLYAAVSSHLGDYETWSGEVFRSDDMEQTWVKVADKTAGVGKYRTYDIIQFNNKLYVVWNDKYGEACGLAESADGGATWTRLSNFTGYVQCRSRLFIYQNQLLTIGSARDGIMALHSNGNVSTHIFPGFHVQDWAYNPLASDSQNRLYIVSDDGRILRTSNLSSWETLVASDREFFTLGYWPGANSIVVADRGSVGSVWQLNPVTTAITRPPAVDPTISLSGNDVVLQWQGQSGLDFRIYRNATPDFAPALAYFHSAVTATTWTDPGVGAQVGGMFYQVRSRNAAHDISAPSPTLGKFTFALTH